MKDTTKAKVKQIGEKVAALAGPVFTGLTIAAAWLGYKGALANAKEINRLGKCHDGLCDIVTHNANCSRHDRGRIEDLERQNAILMEKALMATEGKSA